MGGNQGNNNRSREKKKEGFQRTPSWGVMGRFDIGEGLPHDAPFSAIEHTVSRLSRVTLSASSTTELGRARFAAAGLPLLSAADGAGVPFDFFPLAASTPLVVGARLVSLRTSSRTRRRRAGKVVTSPERRRAMAWFSTVVGQLAGCAWRECRR